jgi:peptidoglycan/xylan/chitin deacetylase (PgdA/CDA1 family)
MGQTADAVRVHSFAMAMKRLLKHVLRALNSMIARMCVNAFPEKDSLIIVLLHSVVEHEMDFTHNVIDPSLAITRSEFSAFVTHFLEEGYSFVSPHDLMGQLGPGRYAMITFDDGYANNRFVIPLLSEHRVPATIYLSTDHIESGKCFWWDVLCREGRKRGMSTTRVKQEIGLLGRKRTTDIERSLRETFGEGCLEPRSDLDRPLAVREVRDLSDEKYVFWGNHTSGHAVFRNYDPDEVKVQLEQASARIQEWTGKRPVSVAYPDGFYSEHVIATSLGLGLTVGLTTEMRKNGLPLDDRRRMRLGRFPLKTGRDIRGQCEQMRSDINLIGWVDGRLRGY